MISRGLRGALLILRHAGRMLRALLCATAATAILFHIFVVALLAYSVGTSEKLLSARLTAQHAQNYESDRGASNEGQEVPSPASSSGVSAAFTAHLPRVSIARVLRRPSEESLCLSAAHDVKEALERWVETAEDGSENGDMEEGDTEAGGHAAGTESRTRGSARRLASLVHGNEEAVAARFYRQCKRQPALLIGEAYAKEATSTTDDAADASEDGDGRGGGDWGSSRGTQRELHSPLFARTGAGAPQAEPRLVFHLPSQRGLMARIAAWAFAYHHGEESDGREDWEGGGREGTAFPRHHQRHPLPAARAPNGRGRLRRRVKADEEKDTPSCAGTGDISGGQRGFPFETSDVVVVGAGIAGIAAARTIVGDGDGDAEGGTFSSAEVEWPPLPHSQWAAAFARGNSDGQHASPILPVYAFAPRLPPSSASVPAEVCANFVANPCWERRLATYPSELGGGVERAGGTCASANSGAAEDSNSNESSFWRSLRDDGGERLRACCARLHSLNSGRPSLLTEELASHAKDDTKTCQALLSSGGGDVHASAPSGAFLPFVAGSWHSSLMGLFVRSRVFAGAFLPATGNSGNHNLPAHDKRRFVGLMQRSRLVEKVSVDFAAAWARRKETRKGVGVGDTTATKQTHSTSSRGLLTHYTEDYMALSLLPPQEAVERAAFFRLPFHSTATPDGSSFGLPRPLPAIAKLLLWAAVRAAAGVAAAYATVLPRAVDFAVRLAFHDTYGWECALGKSVRAESADGLGFRNGIEGAQSQCASASSGFGRLRERRVLEWAAGADDNLPLFFVAPLPENEGASPAHCSPRLAPSGAAASFFGYTVKVVEGRGRLGGRIHTVSTDTGEDSADHHASPPNAAVPSGDRGPTMPRTADLGATFLHFRQHHYGGAIEKASGGNGTERIVHDTNPLFRLAGVPSSPADAYAFGRNKDPTKGQFAHVNYSRCAYVGADGSVFPKSLARAVMSLFTDVAYDEVFSAIGELLLRRSSAKTAMAAGNGCSGGSDDTSLLGSLEAALEDTLTAIAERAKAKDKSSRPLVSGGGVGEQAVEVFAAEYLAIISEGCNASAATTTLPTAPLSPPAEAARQLLALAAYQHLVQDLQALPADISAALYDSDAAMGPLQTRDVVPRRGGMASVFARLLQGREELGGERDGDFPFPILLNASVNLVAYETDHLSIFAAAAASPTPPTPPSSLEEAVAADEFAFFAETANALLATAHDALTLLSDALELTAEGLEKATIDEEAGDVASAEAESSRRSPARGRRRARFGRRSRRMFRRISLAVDFDDEDSQDGGTDEAAESIEDEDNDGARQWSFPSSSLGEALRPFLSSAVNNVIVAPVASMCATAAGQLSRLLIALQRAVVARLQSPEATFASEANMSPKTCEIQQQHLSLANFTSLPPESPLFSELPSGFVNLGVRHLGAGPKGSVHSTLLRARKAVLTLPAGVLLQSVRGEGVSHATPAVGARNHKRAEKEWPIDAVRFSPPLPTEFAAEVRASLGVRQTVKALLCFDDGAAFARWFGDRFGGPDAIRAVPSFFVHGPIAEDTFNDTDREGANVSSPLGIFGDAHAHVEFINLAAFAEAEAVGNNAVGGGFHNGDAKVVKDGGDGSRHECLVAGVDGNYADLLVALDAASVVAALKQRLQSVRCTSRESCSPLPPLSASRSRLSSWHAPFARGGYAHRRDAGISDWGLSPTLTLTSMNLSDKKAFSPQLLRRRALDEAKGAWLHQQWPVDRRTAFAGEHCSWASYGNLQGAYETGVCVARDAVAGMIAEDIGSLAIAIFTLAASLWLGCVIFSVGACGTFRTAFALQMMAFKPT